MAKGVGRTSRIKVLRYEDEITYLLSQGYSYYRVAQLINQRYPNNPRINKDTIWRFVKGRTKKLRNNKTMGVEELINDIFDEFYYKIKVSSLQSIEKRALIEFMKAKQRKLFGKLNQTYKVKPYSEFEKVRKLILDFSRCLCLKCREKVLEAIGN